MKRSLLTMAVVGILYALASPFVLLWDFQVFFYPAFVELAHGRTPYTVPGVYNAPWGLLPFAPLGFLPYPVAKALFVALMAIGIYSVPIMLGFPKWATFLYLCSPPVLFCLWFGNLDWVPLLGLLVAPFPFGVLLAMVKPHVGIGLVLFWMVTRKDRALVAAWTLACVALSLLFFGDWPRAFFTAMPRQVFVKNVSLWPFGIVGGVLLLGLAVKWRKPVLALASSPFFSPYVLFYSYSGTMLGLASLGAKHDHS